MNLKYVLRTLFPTLCNAAVQLIDCACSDSSGSEMKGDHP
jgi:hypothetical protein